MVAFVCVLCREIGAKRKKDAAEKAEKDEDDRRTAKERWGGQKALYATLSCPWRHFCLFAALCVALPASARKMFAMRVVVVVVVAMVVVVAVDCCCFCCDVVTVSL